MPSSVLDTECTTVGLALEISAFTMLKYIACSDNWDMIDESYTTGWLLYKFNFEVYKTM